MAFFRKKKEEKLEFPTLPDLPEIVQPSSLQKKPETLPPLPHLEKEKTEQDIVKEVIKNPEISFPKESPSLEEIPSIKKPLVKEIDSSEVISSLSPSLPQIPSLPKETKKEITPPQIKQTFPIEKNIPETKTEDILSQTPSLPKITKQILFVKIDDYKNAIQKLQEVKSKVMEIEKLLEDIKEIKVKEEIELEEWEKEIRDAKSKLEKIDKILFSEE